MMGHGEKDRKNMQKNERIRVLSKGRRENKRGADVKNSKGARGLPPQGGATELSPEI